MNVRHRLARLPIPLYRARLGWLLGHRFVLIEHRGRKSGRPRYVVVEVLRWDAVARRIVVVSGYGPRSDWFRNVRAEPRVRVSTGREHRVPGVAHLLKADDTAHALRDYREQHPLAARVLGWMLGEDLHGEIGVAVAERLPGVAIDLAPRE